MDFSNATFGSSIPFYCREFLPFRTLKGRIFKVLTQQLCALITLAKNQYLSSKVAILKVNI